MNTDNFVTIRTYHDHIVGELMISVLHNAGIRVFRFEEMHSMLPTENVEIKVHESDVDAALEIIEAQENI
ncbi:MAG: hypothetical protein KA270_12775 [Saprospiraceae bacterium]|jgi:hypothetical protein|nr:hypothetical protein [Saprospiraceae bacterium]MBP6236708.1 hypothetical protein [Saprospiraceae bacterium]MBP6568036.1 hypothetical protein [Saprospiraceae bacterium]